jgi:hypothetical protein
MRFRRPPPRPAPPQPPDPDVLRALVHDPDGPHALLGAYGQASTALTSGAPLTLDIAALVRQGITRLTIATGSSREEVEQTLEQHFGPLPFTCPRCHRTSHHPDDKRYGYCGACHAYTGEPR